MECRDLPICELPSDINNAHPREAMGLTLSYSATTFETTEFTGIGPNLDNLELARVVENRLISLRHRLTAGSLLALLGDPRINVFDPPMASFKQQTALLGTLDSQVDELIREYSRLSIKREWIQKECPTYLAEIPPYRLGRYPVTNYEYLSFLKSTATEKVPRSWYLGRYPIEHANHPVWGVRKEWCLEYCAWLSLNTGRDFVLPSESQWEAAAGGVERREFPWGNSYAVDCANTVESGVLSTTPIGAFPAGQTPDGIFDLGGNVEEFVMESYQPYGGTDPQVDDLYRSNQLYPMTRGGCFSRFRDLARSRRRHGFFDSSLYAYGFRLAENIS